MVTSTIPNAPSAPTLSRERARSTGRTLVAPKKVNALQLAVMVGIILLCASAFWRVTHSTSVNANMVQVVVFNKDVPAGVRISFMMLRFMDVPKQYVTPDMVRSLNTVINHQTRSYVPANEPISSNMFFPEANGISRNLRANERAITLQLGDDALVDHSIRPDDRVDVLVISTKGTKKYTKTICQAARVLVVAPKEQMMDRQLSRSLDKITLAVAPELTETLSEAADSGKLRLVLRNPNILTSENLSGSGPDDIVPASALISEMVQTPVTTLPPPPTPADGSQTASAFPEAGMANQPAPGPIEWMVQIISGSHRETVSVPGK